MRDVGLIWGCTNDFANQRNTVIFRQQIGVQLGGGVHACHAEVLHTKITLRNTQPSLNGKNRVLSYNKKRITNKSRKGMESCAFLVRVSNSKATMENSKAVN